MRAWTRRKRSRNMYARPGKSGSGLPHNTVMAMAQTADGYVWLGTEEGLARFDGDRFTVFDKRNTPGPSKRFYFQPAGRQ